MSNLDMSLDQIIKKDSRKTRRGGRRSNGRGRGRSNAGRRGGRRKSYGAARNSGGRSRKGRFRPYEHIGDGTVKDIAFGAPENRVMKVSSGSEVKKVAGAIAHCVRLNNIPPAIMCTGPEAINQAIKAIAVARTFLADEEDDNGNVVDLICTPRFEGQTEQLVIRLRRSRPLQMDKEIVELTATKACDPYKLAGAIAHKIRDGERVGLTACGPLSVLHAVESIYVSKGYLKDDRVDIKFSPMFDVIDTPKGERNCIHFSLLSRRLDD